MDKPHTGLDLGATAPQTKDIIKDTTTKDFVEDVIKASADTHIVVDFWSPRCGPCKQLTPILEKYVTQAEGAIKLVKMNVDEHPAVFSQLAAQLGTQSIPAILVFKNGQPVDGFMGALPESQVKSFLAKFVDEALDDDIEAVLETADEAFNEEDFETALEVYSAVLEEDQENIKAMAGIAKCHIKMDNIEEAQKTLDLVPENSRDNANIANALAMLEVVQASDGVGDIADLQNKIAQNPDDHQSRIDLAVALNANGQKEQALDALFESMTKKRDWDDEAAKKQLLQFLEAWGPQDPQTIEGRKRLSLLLFS